MMQPEYRSGQLPSLGRQPSALRPCRGAPNSLRPPAAERRPPERRINDEMVPTIVLALAKAHSSGQILRLKELLP